MDPFLGEIRLMAFDFAPKGWARCDGSILTINQNQALYSLLGTAFGGNGTTTFALPDYRGRVPVHWGQTGTGYTYLVGNVGGAETVQLTANTMPMHTHHLTATNKVPAVNADNASPSNNLTGTGPFPNSVTSFYGAFDAPLTAMAAAMVGTAGSSAAHNNCMPTMALAFCIATQGLYPPRQ